MSAGGKGDAPRPFTIPREDFEARWDAIFGNKKPAAAPQVEVPRFCPDCGKRVTEGHVHTCTPKPKAWEGLTDGEIEELLDYHSGIAEHYITLPEVRNLIETVQRWLRERNT